MAGLTSTDAILDAGASWHVSWGPVDNGPSDLRKLQAQLQGSTVEHAVAMFEKNVVDPARHPGIYQNIYANMQADCDLGEICFLGSLGFDYHEQVSFFDTLTSKLGDSENQNPEAAARGGKLLANIVHAMNLKESDPKLAERIAEKASVPAKIAFVSQLATRDDYVHADIRAAHVVLEKLHSQDPVEYEKLRASRAGQWVVGHTNADVFLPSSYAFVTNE